MTLAALLPLPVAIIIVGAIAAPLLARVHPRAAFIVGMVATSGATAVLVAAATRVYAGHGHVVTTFLSNEQPHRGRVLGIAFAADPFGMVFALLAAGLGTVLLLALLSEFGELGP